MSSSTNEFDLLFSPLQVGPITLRNRIINSPHQSGFARDGRYTDQLIAYQRERARGGAALVMSQATSVTGEYLDLWNSSDDIIPQYKDIVSAVGEFGAHYGAELWHPGRLSEYGGTGAEVYVAPSATPTNYFGIQWRVPHELDASEIEYIVSMFGQAAERCRAGGLSAIELHFAHGNLIEQFLSPVTNNRRDDYGGSFENRLRIAEDILRVVRTAIGHDMALGCRLSGGGLDPGEPTDLDMAEIAGTLASWDLLDYISVTMGHYADALNTARNIPNMTFRPGLWGRYGKQMKQVVDIPIFLVGRINHPDVAEQLLDSGSCDAVVMARGLIADAHFGEKARTGRTSQIRPCVGAMNCLNHLNHGGSIRCIYNPTVSREGVWDQEPPAAETPQHVAVVGAGPAGLEFARTAASRGHRVTVLERSSRVGGQVPVAASAPDRAELSQIAEWLEQECLRHGVDFRLGTAATADVLSELAADSIVVATGSSLPPNPFAGGPLPTPTWAEALAARTSLGHVVVFDDFGDWQGFDVARSLLDHGSRVTYVTTAVYPGSALEMTNWRLAYEAMTAMGVEWRPVSTVVDVAASSVSIASGFTRDRRTIDDVDALVWVGMPVADNTLAAELTGQGLSINVIGDAYSPRGIEAAVYDGHKLARAI